MKKQKKSRRRDKDLLKAFGMRLAQVRINKGLTQVELSKMTGLKQVSISRYESGINGPQVECLIALAEELDVSTDFLLGRTDVNECT